MLSSVDMMVKRSLETELDHIKLMLNGDVPQSAAACDLIIVQQYIKNRVSELS